MNTSLIVAGWDGSPAARAAMNWAAADADHRAATLRLVHVLTTEPAGEYTPLIVSAPVMDTIGQRAVRLLTAASAGLTADHPGLAIEIAVREGSPAAALSVESAEAAVTVLGPHGANRLAGAFFGSVAARVAGHGRGVIVIARPEPATRPGKPGVVVVGVDGSAHSRAAVGFAYEEAALRGVSLVAIRTWNDKPLDNALSNYPLEIDAAGIDQLQDQILDIELAGWENKYPDVPVQRRVIRGRAAPTLLRYASGTTGPPTQLLVVGSRGRGGFAGLLLGSTSQALIAHAECSVAVVHSERGNLRHQFD